MTLFSNVVIYVDRERSGRFDDWMAHLESVIVLGDFEESRKIVLLRSKLYGEAAEEFDNFKLENPIRAESLIPSRSGCINFFIPRRRGQNKALNFIICNENPRKICVATQIAYGKLLVWHIPDIHLS
jgi:hypothetical protein